jgi:hypothetical protein
MNSKKNSFSDPARAHRSERGAALITVLMVSTLLIATGGALVMSTALSARTALDSTSEMQAYYSAESGLQQTLSVLRGQVNPNAAMPAGTQINFRNAVTAATSNLPSDSSPNRLSGWLNYDYTPSGAPSPDRVSLTTGYSPMMGLAYSVSVTDPDNIPVATGEPNRLLLNVTGYGPKGAVKQMELIVNRSNFDLQPVATILMVSATDGSPMTFSLGDSAAKDYSGHDVSSSTVLPTLGATSGGDQTIETNADTKNTVASPASALVGSSSLPSYLQTADQARLFLADQKLNAISQGRYFSTFSGTSGSTASPAFTFVDGDCVLDGGAGLLIVTGNLEMNGNPNFNGLILVLGGGTVNRNGGGNGNIFGAMIVASFDVNGTGGFTAPSFTTNGGGNSTMQYDSDAVRKALNMSGPRVWGVHEY